MGVRAGAAAVSQGHPPNRLQGMDTSSEGHGEAATACAERVWAEFVSALDMLPPATRAVFLLHALFDASWDDIERTTGVRKDRCGRRIEEARRAMRDHARGGHDPMRDPDP